MGRSCGPNATCALQETARPAEGPAIIPTTRIFYGPGVAGVTALLYQTDASRLVEYTQVNERMPLKELGKLAPYLR